MTKKVKIGFLTRDLSIPQVCCRCCSPLVAGTDIIFNWQYLSWNAKRIVTWSFSFPYCKECLAKIKKRRLFKGKDRAVGVSEIKVVGYGSLLRRKKLPYATFKFKNDKYGELFREANKDRLFEEVRKEVAKKK